MKTETLPIRAPAGRSTALAPDAMRAGWQRVFLFLLLVAGPAGVVIHLIATYAVDVPFWDQWETARFFTASHYGHESLLELARQQNESRLLFPNLIFLALSLPGNWSVVREMYFSVALVVAISAVLFQLLRRTGFPLVVQAILLFGINWLLFSLTQHENWFFGIQICYYLPPTCLCFALWANISHRTLAWKTLVSFGLSFVAAYSFSGGVLICALAFPGFLPANWSAAGRWLPGRREWLWHGLYIAGSAIMLTAYFWDYQEPAGAGSLLYIFKHLDKSLAYFFVWLGTPLRPHGTVPETMAMGVGAFLILSALLAAAWRTLGGRKEHERLYPWVMLAGYAVGTGAVTTIGRSGFGTPQALSSRYISFSSYAYVAILVLAAYLWCFHRRRVVPAVRAAFLACGLILFSCLGWLFVQSQLLTVPWIIDGSHHRRFAMQGLVFMQLMPSSQNLDALCGVPQFVQKQAMNLMRRHILDVPVASPGLRESIQKVSETGDIQYGEMDQPDMASNGRVSIRGWAVDPAMRRPAGSVLITCTDKDGVTHPLVVLMTDVYRPELAPAADEYQKMPCGFMQLVNFDRLAPGDYLVAAWVVNIPQNRVNQIATPFHFEWKRPGTLARSLDTIDFPPFDPRLDARNGYLEEAAPQPGGKLLNARGWAIDVNSYTVPKAVLITCTDTKGVTRVVGHVGPGDLRQDVADLFHNDSLTYCGFSVQADLGSLPPGNYQVGAWGVGDDDEENPFQLGGTFPVQVAPK